MKIYRHGNTIVSLENVKAIEPISTITIRIAYMEENNFAWISCKKDEIKKIIDEIEIILKKD